MEKSKKIKKEELERLNQIVQSAQSIKTALGELEIQRAKAIEEYKKIEAALQEEQKALEANYGDVTIDLSTGEYKDNEKAEMTVAE
jgi:allophanate hydrolase subunit 1